MRGSGSFSVKKLFILLLWRKLEVGLEELKLVEVGLEELKLVEVGLEKLVEVDSADTLDLSSKFL